MGSHFAERDAASLHNVHETSQEGLQEVPQNSFDGLVVFPFPWNTFAQGEGSLGLPQELWQWCLTHQVTRLAILASGAPQGHSVMDPWRTWAQGHGCAMDDGMTVTVFPLPQGASLSDGLWGHGQRVADARIQQVKAQVPDMFRVQYQTPTGTVETVDQTGLFLRHLTLNGLRPEMLALAQVPHCLGGPDLPYVLKDNAPIAVLSQWGDLEDWWPLWSESLENSVRGRITVFPIRRLGPWQHGRWLPWLGTQPMSPMKRLLNMVLQPWTAFSRGGTPSLRPSGASSFPSGGALFLGLRSVKTSSYRMQLVQPVMEAFLRQNQPVVLWLTENNKKHRGVFETALGPAITEHPLFQWVYSTPWGEPGKNPRFEAMLRQAYTSLWDTLKSQWQFPVGMADVWMSNTVGFYEPMVQRSGEILSLLQGGCPRWVVDTQDDVALSLFSQFRAMVPDPYETVGIQFGIPVSGATVETLQYDHFFVTDPDAKAMYEAARFGAKAIHSVGSPEWTVSSTFSTEAPAEVHRGDPEDTAEDVPLPTAQTVLTFFNQPLLQNQLGDPEQIMAVYRWLHQWAHAPGTDRHVLFKPHPRDHLESLLPRLTEPGVPSERLTVVPKDMSNTRLFAHSTAIGSFYSAVLTAGIAYGVPVMALCPPPEYEVYYRFLRRYGALVTEDLPSVEPWLEALSLKGAVFEELQQKMAPFRTDYLTPPPPEKMVQVLMGNIEERAGEIPAVASAL